MAGTSLPTLSAAASLPLVPFGGRPFQKRTKLAANTNPTPEAMMIEELKALAEKATPGPWEYRPGEYDDWGVIKGPPFRPDGFEYDLRPFIAQCRSPNLSEAELGQHRANKTDPWETDAALIVALVNNLPAILSALSAVPVMKEALGPHVFLDCDGVLADFDSYAETYFGMNPREYEAKVGSAQFWQELEAKGDFYRNLPVMPDARELYEGVKHLHPTILTGCPRGNWAQGQKVAWAAEHFPGVPIITCRSADKRDYAKPGDVLIDDWPQHRHRWIEAGGVFIVHHDAQTSLAALWAHYPDLARQALAALEGK
jgi:5'(3')-deoxyribonucleotidase